MTAINWQNAVSGDWNDATLWSTGTVPGAGDSAVVSADGFYTISATASIDVGAVALTYTGATLAISSPGQANFVAGDFINLGTLAIDTNFGGGGSTLVIGGTLGNANIVQIGPGFGVFPGALTAPTMVTAGELVNTGSIVLYGGQANQATLNIESAAPTIVNGYLALYNNSLLEFAGGEITSIAEGSEILLSGTNAGVADADNPSTSSALLGLASNAGILDLQNGASVTIDGSFSNGGAMDIDSGVEEGGSALTIDGTLFNSGLLQIGSPAEDPSASTTVAVDDLAGVGLVQLFGGSGTDTNQAVLDIDAEVAPGTLMFDLEVHGDSSVNFASGDISAIGDQGTLVLDGMNASVASAKSAGNGTALNLTNNAGDLELDNGASLVIGNDLTNEGVIYVDAGFLSEGGSTLTVSGTLINNGSLQIGSSVEYPIAAATTVTAGDLVSTGSIRLYGGSADGDTNQSILDITAGAAPGTLTSDLEVYGTALAEFAGGEISAIGSSGTLVVDGAAAFVADAGSTDSNSALTALSSNTGTLVLDDGAVVDAGGLTSNAGVLAIENGASLSANLASSTGDLELHNGVTLTTPGDFDNAGTVNIDTGYSEGGSVLTVNGTLTNSGTMQIGSLYNNPDAPTTVTAEKLISTGAITLDGGTGSYTSQAVLDIMAGTAPGTLTSDLELYGTALVEFASGEISTIGFGGTLVLDGAAAFVADAGSTDTNSALVLISNAGMLEIEDGASLAANLASNTGDLDLQSGGTLTILGNFENTGAVNIDAGYGDGDAGSMLTVNGTLTNDGAIQIGPLFNDLDGPITVTAEDLVSTGSIRLYGGSFNGYTSQADLDITARAAPGTLTSDLEVSGPALAEFGSGEISAIGLSGTLEVDGTAAFVADAGNTDSNSALALTSNAGLLEIENGASVNANLVSNTGDLELENGITLTTSGNFENTGGLSIDTGAFDGGSTLTVNGTLINSGIISIGWDASDPEAPTTVHVEDLTSTGFIRLYGGTLEGDTSQVVLDVEEGVAPGTLTSDIEVHGNALLEFASGAVSAIGIGGELVVDGTAAFVADAGSTDSNSALTGLSSNAGVLEIENGASLQTSLTNSSGQLDLSNDASLETNGNFDNSYILRLDEGYDDAGSTLTVNGTLTNTSYETMSVGSGSGSPGTSTEVTAGGLINSGVITLSGGTDGNTYQAVLDVAGQVTDTGIISFSGNAVLNTASLDIGSGGSVADSGSINADTLTIESGGSLSGFGVLPGLIDDGVLTASGGDLDVAGAIAGGGQLTIGTSGTLELGGAASQIVSFTTSNGTLKLDIPSRFSGEITGLTAGDTIDLTALTATSAAIVGSSLIITTAGAQALTYQISGALVGSSFQIQSDGNGGSDLVLTPQTTQSQPYDNFYTAVDALATDISDNAPSDQITTDAVNVYTAAIAGAIGTVGDAAWQQAYTTSSIAAAAVGNDLADSQAGSQLLADTLSLYNTIIAGAAGSIAGGVSQDEYTNILQAAGTLSTDILNGASINQLQSDLANLYSTLASAMPNATNPSGWQSAQSASDQALTTLSTDIGSGAGTSQILSDISSLYDTILSDSLDAIGGTSLQAAYAGGTQTLAGLGGDIASGASAGNLQGDIEGVYNSIVSAVSSGTSASALENYGTVTEAAETLLSQVGTFSTSNLYDDASSLFSTVVSTQPLTLSVLGEIVAAAGSSILNINSIEASLQPPSIDSTDWSLIADRLSSQLGDTTQSLLTALSQAATTLAQVGEATTDVATLLDYELEQASGIMPNITLAATADLSSSGNGLDLSLTRTYSASLLSRNDAGPFGDGWTFTYDIDAVTDASGNVYITSPSGTEVFTLQAGGTYSAEPGDSSTLTVANGAYVLTNIGGTVEDLLPDGQISSITDSNGNTINISYGSNGVISGVVSSNGQSLTFTSNAQGQITSATNQDGQQTSYSYDASGDQLISVSGPDGVTTYTYASSGNPFTQNALTQITNPDGATETFQYDSIGDLISESGSNGADQIDYSYPSPGTVVTTNAAGDADTLIFGVNGNPAETTDPLGNVTQYEYNSTGELTGVVTPTGGTTTYSYDADGNLFGYTDADGGTVAATYVPGTDLLASLTDQDGNTTTYSDNSAGDLTGVTYSNGDGASYQYSANGLLTSSTDALGQTTTYTYNVQDLLTQETFGDGTYQAYTYNALGELTSAQATNGGITTYAYNAAGELTSVTNPVGQVESYTYNSAGQGLTRTEPDGSVTQYIYNSNGQLAEIQDGSGNLITQYTYDTEGQLIGSLDGNGQTTSYTYDADGEVTQILTTAADGSVTSDLTYTYNSDGLPSTATSSDGTWTYTYDADGQLTNAVFASTNLSIADQNLTYEYDAAGNRTETIFNGAVNNYTTNGLNQYTASDGTTYDYDADGNLVSVTQNGATTTYTYNSQNQLIAVSGPSGDYTYQYDALGNVVSSTDNGVVTNYIIDPLAIDTSATGPLSAIAQAYDTAGNVTATYDYGNGLAAEITTEGTYYYNTDAIGNVVSLSGADGAPVDTYDYAPFGTLLASSGDVANPFQFAGGWGITTGADGLIDMRARYYDPTTGRFLSPDPINISWGYKPLRVRR